MGVRKRRRLPWGWIWAGLLMAGGGGGYYWWQQNTAAQAGKLPPGVQTSLAQRGDIDQKITATGVVAAQIGAKVNIGSQIAGRILSLPADVGTRVRVGQVVAVLDVPDLAAQVDQQQQGVRAARATLVQAEERLRQALLSEELTREQTAAQIEEATHALQGTRDRLTSAEAMAELTPTQTATEISRAEASVSIAQAQERQVRQTVNLQLFQAQAGIDEARAGTENSQRLLRRQEALLVEGFIARQDVENTRAAYLQAAARQRSAQANLDIVKEKTSADLQAAREQVRQAEASLEAARAARLQNAMREADARSAGDARRQAEATLALQRSNRTQILIRKRAVAEARSAVSQARASLKQAEAQVRFQAVQLDRATIRSPINGTVLSITAQQGEVVAAGFNVSTLITVADLSRLEVRAYVDEVDVGRTRLGQPAEVRVETFPGRVFRGRVTKIAAASTVKDNVVTYETTILLDNPGDLLRPDMTADVTLVLGRTPNVLRVPSEAIHREVDRTVIYVLHREKQGKERVETRPVTTGIDDGNFTQVRSGLKEGEEVVLAGLQRLGVKAVDAQDAEGKKDEK